LAAASGLALLEPTSEWAGDLARNAAQDARGFGGEDFSVAGALGDFTRRYRLTLTGGSIIRAASLQLSVDERSDGSATMRIAVRRLGETIEDRSFALSDDAYTELAGLLARSGLWSVYPEIWVLSDPNAICAHGRDIVLERLDDTGYGLAHARAGCTSPSEMNAIAFKMLTLARPVTQEDWLQWVSAR
jgi:hypothetical protein